MVKSEWWTGLTCLGAETRNTLTHSAAMHMKKELRKTFTFFPQETSLALGYSSPPKVSWNMQAQSDCLSLSGPVAGGYAPLAPCVMPNWVSPYPSQEETTHMWPKSLEALWGKNSPADTLIGVTELQCAVCVCVCVIHVIVTWMEAPINCSDLICIVLKQTWVCSHGKAVNLKLSLWDLINSEGPVTVMWQWCIRWSQTTTTSLRRSHMPFSALFFGMEWRSATLPGWRSAARS